MKCKIISGDVMKIERDERQFDFHDTGLAIKRAREAKKIVDDFTPVFDKKQYIEYIEKQM